MTQEGLESKRETLDELERSETEARRLEAALGRGRANGIASPRSPLQGEDAANEEGQGDSGGEAAEEPSSAHLPPHPGPNPVRRRPQAPGMGLLSALSYTLHGMMDVDPETARRNGITKTRESISQVRISNFFFFVGDPNNIHPADSWRMLFIYRLKISNIQAQPFKQTWTASSGRKLLT